MFLDCQSCVWICLRRLSWLYSFTVAEWFFLDFQFVLWLPNIMTCWRMSYANVKYAVNHSEFLSNSLARALLGTWSKPRPAPAQTWHPCQAKLKSSFSWSYLCVMLVLCFGSRTSFLRKTAISAYFRTRLNNLPIGIDKLAMKQRWSNDGAMPPFRSF